MINLKALILGGAGFVGKHLIRHLRDDLKWDISVTKMKNEKVEEKDIKVYDLDIMNLSEIKQVMEQVQPDTIFHLAAQSSVALSWKNPGLTIDVNIKGSVNVLDTIRFLSFKPRILLIGSGEEYGHIRPEETPVKEETILRPGNIYAATKAAQNMIGKIYADAYTMDIIIIRAFNHIGAGQAPIFVVSDFCRQVAQIEKGLIEPVIKVGNLCAKRDFLDVADVIRAYALLAQKGRSGEVYNVGSGKSISIQEILNLILSKSSHKISVLQEKDRFRPIDVAVIEADINKLQKDTGWKAEISISDTISDVLEYWRKNV